MDTAHSKPFERHSLGALTIVLLTTFSQPILGCASSTEVNGHAGDYEDVSSADIASGETFKLYDSFNAQPNPSCDKHTRMTVTKSARTPGALIVNTENAVSGNCDLLVKANKMQFKVMPASTDRCGSKLSTGDGALTEPATSASGSPAVTARTPIKISDNRARICEDVRSPVEVTIGDGATAKRLFAARF